MSLPQNDLPLIVSAGEALTDLVTAGGNAWHAHPGGAGWNVARACASLGVPSAFAGAVGGDNFGDDLTRASQAPIPHACSLRRAALYDPRCICIHQL